MKEKNNKITSLKSIFEPKYPKFQFHISRSISNFRSKTNYHLIKDKKFESDSVNYIINPNIIEKSLEKCNNSQNNKKIGCKSEKQLKIDKYLWREKEKRKIIIKNPLNLSQKFTNIKLSLSKGKNKLSFYSLDGLNNNSLFLNYRINLGDKKEKNEKSTIKIEKEINTYNYYKTNKSNNTIDIKEKGLEFSTEGNMNTPNRKLYKNLFLKSKSSISNSRNEMNMNKTSKHNSYDGSKKILSKIKTIKEKIKNFAPCIYIKVNKNQINKNKTIDINSNKNNNNINNINNLKNNIINKNNTIIVERQDKSQKLINLKNKNIDKKEKIAKKPMKTILDNNNDNNNIFLDKTYQNRFNKKPKNNIIKNDIFTTEKQKEYNTIVVKKRNNYLNTILTISTTNSSNSSNHNNNSNIYNKNWVYRLYDEEIKKQKKRDKLIYSLRKSILSESSKNKQKKELNKSNTIKDFNYNKYTNNFHQDFNIINLFLSDEKKNKCKNIKKYKRKNYISDNNKNENVENNNPGKKRSNSKYRKSKKDFLFINEELINEEDEEKERDEDEK